MSDWKDIYEYLQARPGWNNSADMQRAMRPNAVGWAMRSRISIDLNKVHLPKLGYHIESRIGGNGMAEYRLVKIQAEQMDLAV